MMNSWKHSLLAALLLPAAPALFAQTAAPPFSMRVQIQNRVETPSDGGTLVMPADGIGSSISANLTLTYTNTTATNTSVSLNGVTFSGSTDFAVSGTGSWPVNLTVGSPTTTVGLQYTPAISRQQTAKVVFNYTQTVAAPSGNTVTNGTLTLNLSGTSPEFVYSYTPLPGGNSTLLNSGDTIVFPLTEVFDTSSTLIVLTNRGSGQGVVNGITYAGSRDFALAGLPFPPTTVDANRDLRFQVQFTPSDLPAVNGNVRVDIAGNRTLTFRVTGRGSGAVYEYDVIQKNTAIPLAPLGLIALADVAVSEKSQVVVRVRNVGNEEGIIKAIGVSGPGFSLSETPFLPVSILYDSSFTFTVNFTPTQPGKQLGKLRIGDDTFDLAATGLGATLTYAYVSGNSTFPLPTGTSTVSVVFAPIAVGQSSVVRITVSNTGTASAAVNSISVGGPTATTFTLSGLPPVPANVGPGETIGFDVSFAPTTIGTIAGTLRIDNQTYTLTGIGNAPNPLPGYSFQGASGFIDPLQQPAVGLTLGANYPLDLNGVLTLGFNSDVFANDPSVQFATGGRTVSFTIPANTRQAVFSNRATQVRVQSGTVAGLLVFTPGFVTSGGIDVTPTSPAVLTLTVPQQAPVLLNVVQSARTANTITLLVTGYATSRSITQMDFQFTPASTETVATTKVSLNVEGSFNAWYQSAASAAFGSNVSVTIPFTLQGDISKVVNLAETVQSVSVTLSNRQGTSAAKSIDLR